MGEITIVTAQRADAMASGLVGERFPLGAWADRHQFVGLGMISDVEVDAGVRRDRHELLGADPICERGTADDRYAHSKSSGAALPVFLAHRPSDRRDQYQDRRDSQRAEPDTGSGQKRS